MSEREHRGMHGIARNEVCQAASFALGFLAFMLIEAAVNARAAVILGEDCVNQAYALGLVCTGLGFLSFASLRLIFGSDKGRRPSVRVAGILCAVSVIPLLTTGNSAVFAACAALSLFFCGHMSGGVYFGHAMTFFRHPCMGRITGAAMASAVLAQFVVQVAVPCEFAFLACVIASLLLVVLLASKSGQAKVSDDSLLSLDSDRPSGCLDGRSSGCPDGRSSGCPDGRPGIRADGRTARILLLSVALMSLVSGLVDGVITVFDSVGQFDIYHGVRLFYVLGLMLAGWLADFRQRRFFPLATVCSILLSSVSTALLSSPAGYFAGVALMYVYGGFYVIFLTVLFFDFAPRTTRPELWAGLGRVVRCLMVAIVVPITPLLYRSWGSTALTVASCLLSVAVLLTLLPWIARSLPEQSKRPLSKEEALCRFGARYSLTPREMDVLEQVLDNQTGEGTAAALGISGVWCSDTSLPSAANAAWKESVKWY